MQQMATVLDLLHEGVVIVNMTGAIVVANRPARSLLGLPNHAPLGVGPTPNPLAAGPLGATPVERILAGETLDGMAWRLPLPAGVWVEVSGGLLPPEPGQEQLGVLRIAPAPAAPLPGGASGPQAAVMHRWSAYHEADRARIAGMIHDEPLQAVAAAYMMLQLLHRQLAAPEDAAACGDLVSTLKAAVLGLRRVLAELTAPQSINSGIGPALLEYLEQTHSDTGLSFHLADQRPGGAAQPGLLAYRLAQEALLFLRLQVRVTRVDVALTEESGGLAMVLAGSGGPGHARTAPGPGDSWVLWMQEGASLAGGRCEVTWEEDRPGARVHIWLPGGASTGMGDIRSV